MREAVRTFPDGMDCEAHGSLEGTINTPADAVPEETRERVGLLVDDYLDD